MQTFGQKCATSPIIPCKEDIDLRVRLSQEELDEYKEAAYAGDITEVADALTDRLYVLLGDYIAHGLGHLLVPLFNEVQRSNMSKLTEDGKVLRREDGKILKSDQWSPPDLYQIILKDRYQRVPEEKTDE